MAASSFTVVFWCGGREAGEWKRALPVASMEEARKLEASIERGGRVALVNRTEVWDSIGLPDGPPSRSMLAAVGM